MNHPRSWAAGIVSFALMVLAACAALRLAARLLLEALPVLVPAALLSVAAYVAWQWYRRSDHW